PRANARHGILSRGTRLLPASQNSSELEPKVGIGHIVTSMIPKEAVRSQPRAQARHGRLKGYLGSILREKLKSCLRMLVGSSVSRPVRARMNEPAVRPKRGPRDSSNPLPAKPVPAAADPSVVRLIEMWVNYATLEEVERQLEKDLKK